MLFALIAPLGVVAVLGCAAVLLAAGIWAADRAERIYARKDDGRIVIDEVVGQLLTLAPLAVMAGARPRSPGWLAAGFLLFRLMDIWKPGPVRQAERSFPGGAGVMLDDVAAGLLAAGVLALLVLALGGPA